MRLLLLSLLVTSASAQTVRLSASAGAASLGLVGGPGPSVGLSLERPVGAGRLVGAVRLDVTAVDRAGLAEGYAYNSSGATCSERGSGERVDDYLCNAFGGGTDALGAYSAELAYAPPLPLTVALGAGLRFGEIVDRVTGKEGRTQPFALATVAVPLTRRVAVEARARAGADLASGHLGLSVSL